MSLNFILSALGRQLRNSEIRTDFFKKKKIPPLVVWETGVLESKRECRRISQEALAEVQVGDEAGFGSWGWGGVGTVQSRWTQVCQSRAELMDGLDVGQSKRG